LNDDIDVLEAASFDEALQTIQENRDLDLVLADLLMPGMEPFKGIQEIVTAMANVPVVVVSAVENRSDVLRTIDLGAMGYIPKSIPAPQFLEMIRKVLDGQVTLPGDVLKRREPLTPAPQKPGLSSASDARLSGLTKRQKEVLTLLSQGKSNKNIADDLGVSEKTIRFYISAILKTLSVQNRTQAALLAAGVDWTNDQG
jgi:DNA-binding NarL/FixJ family response regulator